MTLTQDTHPESRGLTQLFERAGILIDADEEQQWIKRHRGNGVGGEAVQLAVDIGRDDRDAGGEGPYDFAVLIGVDRLGSDSPLRSFSDRATI